MVKARAITAFQPVRWVEELIYPRRNESAFFINRRSY